MSHTQKLFASLAFIATIGLVTSNPAVAATSVCSMTVTPGISAGYAHTLAVRSDGTLGAWGKNSYGQLGDSTSSDSHVPKQIGTGYSVIAAGREPENPYSLAIKNDRSLWAWGRNAYGQLGDGTTSDTSSPNQIGTETDYAAVTAGSYHSLALKSDGSLWAWGRNHRGQLGDGTTTDSLVPIRIGTDTDYVAIAAGDSHSLALRSDGSLWAWGINTSGQLGDGTNIDRLTPQMIDAGYQAIAAGYLHTVAIKSDGSLWAWGYNDFGQLGDGSQIQKNAPVQIGTETTYTNIAAGFGHTAALNSGGELWTWGYNVAGSLGNGSVVDSLVPKLIGSGYTAIAAGSYHTVALKSDGSLWAWGDNGFGQVGDGTTTSPVTSPKKIVTSGYSVPDFSAPTTPSAFTARQAGAGADLAWTASTDNVGVQGYFVYRNSVLVGSPTATNYKDTGLAPSTAYTYTLAAFDASCNMSSSVSTALTTSSDIQMPMVPSGLKASPNTTSSGVDLSWTASIDDVGVTWYQVYRSGILLPSQGQGNVTSYADSGAGLIASTEYSYSVAACDAAGYCSAQSTPVTVVTPQRLAVNATTITGLTALPKTTGSVDLSWTDSATAATYNVYRNGTLVGNSTTTNYADSGLLASSSYSYSVAACDAGGNCSAQSAPVTAITLQNGATDPTQALSDCLFNWAESNNPSAFAPSGSPSHTDGPYYWRAYTATNAYLAVSSGKLYYLGPLSSDAVFDLGAVSTWYSTAGCQ